MTRGRVAVKFLCDEMLARLGRWLRAAGYDTVIAEGGVPDHLLAARCAADDRILLTKDRQLFAVARSVVRIVLVAEAGIDEAALGLQDDLDIDWQHAPFTRCIVDNEPLDPASPESAVQVPEKSRAAGGRFHVCPACGRLYWPGGHVRRMQQRLARWQDLSAARGELSRLGDPVRSASSG